MKRNPIEVFSDWADLDKDFGMEINHKESVENMLSFALQNETPFSFIDAGCGNGWVVRSVAEHPMCQNAMGVDGSKKMIDKANKIDPNATYTCANLMQWSPEKKVDLVHSMEVFYYMENPKKLIQFIYEKWLKKNGRLIIGLDFYFENKASHDWSESCGISNMKLFSENEWVSFFTDTGFNEIKFWRYGAKENWAGTLIVTGVK
ncbi:MAG: class I SAM-dependent methyltransferase [Flavobacteriaceae bacterium]|nr:class I SAM-dependent methyltransferase [Flavobacteriaceae bacterium]MDG2386890.1 class I SAM-dependent methyltransferase [Flavobacteriaceae bacterium]